MEKVDARKWLMLSVEMVEERKERLENDGSYHTALIGPGDKQKKEWI